MSECFDIMIRQQLGKFITAIDRENGGDRIELGRAAIDGGE